MGIESVIGFHAVDQSTLGVRLADFAVELTAPVDQSPRAAYLDVAQIVEAAKRTGCLAGLPK